MDIYCKQNMGKSEREWMFRKGNHCFKNGFWWLWL